MTQNLEPWIPEQVRQALIRYRDHHIPTGGFLYAVLCNNLKEAIGRADEMNINFIPAIVSWCYNNLPNGSWGTPDAVEYWLNHASAASTSSGAPTEAGEL